MMEKISLRKILEKKCGNFFRLFQGLEGTARNEMSDRETTGWTKHGLEHAQEVERLLDELISTELKKTMNCDEVFILLSGVWWHDHGMVRGPEGRDVHNIISAKRVFNMSDDLFPSQHHKKSVAWLCFAHRDYKEDHVKIRTLGQNLVKEIPGLNLDIINGGIEKYPKGSIHTKFLACLLRLADELDVCFNRAPEQVLREIKSFLKPESLKFWIEHQFIRNVEINPNRFWIKLHFSEGLIRDEFKNSFGIKKLLFSRRGKIEDELKEMKKYFDQVKEDEYHIRYREIKFAASDLVTEEDYQDYHKLIREHKKPPVEEFSATIGEEDLFSVEREVDKVTEPIELEIDKWIKNENILKSGDFFLDSGAYTRDYINCLALLINNYKIERITNAILNIINNKELVIDRVIGISIQGSILATRISFKLNVNLSYIVPSVDENYAHEFEKDFSCTKGEKVLLVLDVIATGKTIEDAIKKIRAKKAEISGIVCVFNRKESTVTKLKEKYNVISLFDKIQLEDFGEDEKQRYGCYPEYKPSFETERKKL